MEPRSSVADFFLPAESGRQDVAAFQIVTLGPEIKEFIDGLYRSDRYKEYLLYHGLAVELTEALADYLQHRLRRYLPADRTEAEAGTRFSFGYPCCPDLELNRTVGELLRAEALGVEFTEEGQMVPEFSTSGFVSFDPAAHYFSLK
jgi:5-methyltetrahydrofolate--homocysteine methyltransferase